MTAIVYIDNMTMEYYLRSGLADAMFNMHPDLDVRMVDVVEVELRNPATPELVRNLYEDFIDRNPNFIPESTAGVYAGPDAGEMASVERYNVQKALGEDVIIASDDKKVGNLKDYQDNVINRWKTADLLNEIHRTGNITDIEYATFRDKMIETGKLTNNSIETNSEHHAPLRNTYQNFKSDLDLNVERGWSVYGERVYRDMGSPEPKGYISDEFAKSHGRVSSGLFDDIEDNRAARQAIRDSASSYDLDGNLTPSASSALDALRIVGAALGAALTVHDIQQTLADVIPEWQKGNTAYVQAELAALAGRNLGGWAAGFLGFEIGAGVGLAVAGPWGAAIGGIIGAVFGGVYGSEFGDALGRWINDALITLNDLLNAILADPLVLDLDGDGVELISLSGSSVLFDLDGDTQVERIGWAGPHDGLLIHDANANGLVDGVSELFGSASQDGFDELLGIDSNADGKIDILDSAFTDLMIWRDANSNGQVDSGEMLTLTQAGIKSFSLNYTVSGVESGGNTIARLGSYTRVDSSQRVMASVWFGMDESGNRPTLPVNADVSDLRNLPNFVGVVSLPDLHVAMYFNENLKVLVADLVTGPHDFESFDDFMSGGFLDVLYLWSGVDKNEPGSTAESLKVSVIEAITGRDLISLTAAQELRIENVWDWLVKTWGVSFLVQAAGGAATDPLFDLLQDIVELDPEDENFESDLIDLTEAAVLAGGAGEPAYDYLDVFALLKFDSSTGKLTGDFDAFVAEWIKNQPSWNEFNVSGMSASPGAIVSSGQMFTTTASLNEEDPEHWHPWTQWFEDQGSLLFSIAAMMDIEADYVMNVTGWRWLDGDAAELRGTASGEVIGQVVSYADHWVLGPGLLGGVTWTKTSMPTHDQRIYGLGGNDTLNGNDGFDRLIGGTGNDSLLGGSGSDIYVYAAGDGLDRITDASGDGDAIYFSSELDPGNLQVTRISGTNDLQLHFGNMSEGIILVGQVNMGNAAIEQFNFVGPAPLKAGDIASIYLESLNSEGNDTITGTKASERLYGLGGNDSLNGSDGDDSVDGGNDNDTVIGGIGNDTLAGGSGNDQLNATQGDDVLIGGTGNDTLSGEGGSDVYIFNLGDGQDYLNDYTVSGTGFGGDDGIRFGSGIAPEDITVEQSNAGANLILKINGTSDQININRTMISADWRIETVTFNNGTVWTHADLVSKSISANTGNNVFYGSYDSEVLEMGSGNDALQARQGDDVLIGGMGNDTLSGDGGNDTYVFNLGDGQDFINEYAANGGGFGGTDTVQFGIGITPADVVVTQGANDSLVLGIVGTTDQITIYRTLISADYRMETVSFVDGTVWSHAELVTRSMLANTGNNLFLGSYDSETLDGGAGNDAIQARQGNDIIIGGTGNDTLSGDGGNDIYVFNLGDGQDYINEYSANGGGAGGTDKIQFGAGIAPTDIVVTQGGSEGLVLGIVGTTDQITIYRTLAAADYRMESVSFDDGTSWSHAELLTKSQLSNSGNDTLFGSYDSETLAGGAGNDVIRARGSNDTLTGGTGNDTLSGDGGSDTYIFNIGDGQDTILEFSTGGGYGGTDTLKFGTGIDTSDVIVYRSANAKDYILQISGTTDSVTIKYGATSMTDYWVEQVQFEDNTIWTRAMLASLAIPMV